MPTKHRGPNLTGRGPSPRASLWDLKAVPMHRSSEPLTQGVLALLHSLGVGVRPAAYTQVPLGRSLLCCEVNITTVTAVWSHW